MTSPFLSVPPFLSVIVPVWRQWPQVGDLLGRLAAQTLPAERFEIVLANNEPAVAPPELAWPELAWPELAWPGLALPGLTLPALALPHLAPPDPAGRKALPGLRVVAAPAPGSYAARNAGAAAARGEWLVFTDADCLPDPGWLAAYAAAIAAGEGGLLAGPVRMVAPPDPDPFAIYDLVRGIPQARYVRHGYAATANLAVARAVFDAVGGFEAGRFSGGDAVFCRAAARLAPPLGRRVRLVEAAVVAHPARAGRDEALAKARRIKGGQIAAGPRPRRLAWTIRSLCPPIRDSLAYLAAPQPWRWRLTAVGVRFRLWAAELGELARLLAGGAPERR